MKTPILGSAYVARSFNAADNRMVNLFPEILPEGGKEPAFLSRTPGLRLHTKVGNGPIRGMHAFGDELFVVSGQELYKVNPTPVTPAVLASWTASPDYCGITGVTNITGSGTVSLSVTTEGYQFTVGTEVWPAIPSSWETIFAGSPHAFAIATLTFDASAPVPLPSPGITCDPGAPALSGTLTMLSIPIWGTWDGVGLMGSMLAGTSTKIVAIGSETSAVSGAFLNHVAVYDIATDNWIDGTDFPHTMEGNPGFACALDEDKVLVIGSQYTSGTNTPYCYVYSISANTWTAKTADTTQGRNSPLVVYDGAGKVYVVGGIGNSGVPAIPANGYSIIRVYDVAADTWSDGPSVPNSVWGQVGPITYHDGKIILIGGYTFTSGATPTQDIRAVDVVTGDVTVLGTTGMPLYAIGPSASTGEAAYTVYASGTGNTDSVLARTTFDGLTSGPYGSIVSTVGVVPCITLAGACNIYVGGSLGFARVG